MYLWFGSKPVIVGSTVGLAKAFLKTNDAALAGRPKFSAGYVKRMKALSKKFDRFMEHVLEEHIERRKSVKDYVAQDMVDVLLQLAEDPSLEVKLERHGVKAFTQDLIAGGTESSAVIQSSLANLLHGFNWRLSDNVKKEDLNMEEIFGLSTPKKIPLEVVAEPRLADHLYSL
ncbi:hypothetical protein P8452_68861 [Trifolium repens]|nr:hypothetical protein P8452_68861 [Trifolium repens]